MINEKALRHAENYGMGETRLTEFIEFKKVEAMKRKTKVPHVRKINVYDFVDFLIKNHCYSKFLFNYGNGDNEKVINLYHLFTDCTNTLNMIAHNFLWSETLQGWQFWSDMDHNWRKEITRLKGGCNENIS